MYSRWIGTVVVGAITSAKWNNSELVPGVPCALSCVCVSSAFKTGLRAIPRRTYFIISPLSPLDPPKHKNQSCQSYHSHTCMVEWCGRCMSTHRHTYTRAHNTFVCFKRGISQSIRTLNVCLVIENNDNITLEIPLMHLIWIIIKRL